MKYVVARDEKGKVLKVKECPTDFDASVWSAHLERRAKKWRTGVKITIEKRKPR